MTSDADVMGLQEDATMQWDSGRLEKINTDGLAATESITFVPLIQT